MSLDWSHQKRRSNISDVFSSHHGRGWMEELVINPSSLCPYSHPRPGACWLWVNTGLFLWQSQCRELLANGVIQWERYDIEESRDECWMEFSWGFSQFGKESPSTSRTSKYSYGKMVYLNASHRSLGESEGLFELHRAQIGEWLSGILRFFSCVSKNKRCGVWHERLR